MQFVLILILAVFYPVAHVLNGFVFRFAEISPHIALIYLPAFLRLFNVLVLRPRDGTVATVLGGILLMRSFNDSTLVGLLNIVCSASAPLLALCLFRHFRKRDVELTSLKDLGLLVMLYAPANALLHHLMWSWLDPAQLEAPIQVFWMVLGDIFGALLGAYMLKYCLTWYRVLRRE